MSAKERYGEIAHAWCKTGKKVLAVCHSGWKQRLQAKRSLPRCGRFGVAAYLRFALLMPRLIGDALLFCYALARNMFWKLQRPIVLPSSL